LRLERIRLSKSHAKIAVGKGDGEGGGGFEGKKKRLGVVESSNDKASIRDREGQGQKMTNKKNQKREEVISNNSKVGSPRPHGCRRHLRSSGKQKDSLETTFKGK